jgi:hypothetical protein
MTRREREQRAYRLVVLGGSAAVLAVVTFVLALAGVLGAGAPLFLAFIAVVSFVLFRRTVAP